MIRRVVLWRWTPDATADEKLRAKEGLSYALFASPVDGVDFGDDLRIDDAGAESHYDLALVRDHETRESWDAYATDATHERVGNYLDSITLVDLTARIDYLYDGPPSRRGLIRHIGLYTWKNGVDEPTRTEIGRLVAQMRSTFPAIRTLAQGNDLGLGTDHADWALEVQFEDVEAARAFLLDPRQTELSTLIASVTREDRRAVLQHRMLSG